MSFLPLDMPQENYYIVLVTALLLSFAGTVAAVLLILRTSHLHIRWSGDHPYGGPQKLHSLATARVGGVAVAFGLMVGLASVDLMAATSLRAELQGFHGFWLVAAAAPLFLLGLLEDVSGTVSVRLRLLAALASGALAWEMGGVRIIQLHLPWIDPLLLSYPVLSTCLTLVAVGGLVHAMNIVDGANGLLAGIAMLMLGAIATVAGRFDEPVLLLLAALGMAAILGFAVFNFPHGRLFCGDAGAYLIGYMAAVFLVLLVLRQPAVSPWFALAVVIHPVTETLYSVWRRAMSGQSPTQPDAQHMHSLWSARLRQRECSTGRPVWLGTNAGAAWRTLATAALPVAAAAVWPSDTALLQWVCGAYVALFVVAIRLLGSLPANQVPVLLARRQID